MFCISAKVNETLQVKEPKLITNYNKICGGVVGLAANIMSNYTGLQNF